MKQTGKILAIIAVVLGLSLLVFSCSKKGNSNTSKTKTAAKVTLKKGYNNDTFSLVTDVGGIHDQSFNQSAWTGLKKLHKNTGLKVSYLETPQESLRVPNLQSLTSQGKSSIIFAIGFLFEDAVKAVAQQNPNQKYAIIDFAYPKNELPNVVSIVFKTQENSFLAGYLSTLVSKTNKIGFIGGVRGAIIDSFEYGYKAGVAWGSYLKKTQTQWMSQDIGSFTNISSAKDAAMSYYTAGADVIFTAAGPAGNGSIEAAKEQNKWAIGVDSDMYSLAPKHVLTSVIKNVGQAIYTLADNYAKTNKFPGGQTKVYGLSDGTLSLTKENLTKDEESKIDKIKAQIVAKKIIVPKNAKEYQTFLKKYPQVIPYLKG